MIWTKLEILGLNFLFIHAFYLKFGSHYERSVRTSASMQLAVIMIAGVVDFGREICVI